MDTKPEYLKLPIIVDIVMNNYKYIYYIHIHREVEK